ncbi:DUF2029 domain-containing protein [Terriglobus albidus]|uniref:DUF2029 domain-containing protein n=1 Tax=Terriglobus albidus TaxID=1592106 RepID=A0A5B9E7Y6_9BACT|nr:glycosyltransferase family 87 protein [Terriglobus albidus]QEE26571.1 DUF2029 domain-containing protein [Terriglobus albidus]
MSTASVVPKATKNPEVNLALTAGITFIWCLVFFICISTINNRPSTFGTLWASGNAANHGLNPYAAYPQTGLTTFGDPDLNYNPPFMLPIIQLFALLPIAAFARAWTITSGLLMTLAGCLLFRRTMQPGQIFWLFISVPVIATFIEGQVYCWPYLFCALALFFFSRNQTAASICIGLVVAMRPNMGLWAVLLFLAGYRKLVLRSAATVAVVYLVPLAIYGTKIYRQWISAFSNDKHWMELSNVGVMPIFARLGHRSIGAFLTVVIAAFVIWWAYRKKPDFTSVGTVGLCAAILCSPIAWFNYVMFAAPFLTARRWGKVETIAAVLLVLPYALLHDYSFPLYFAATTVFLIIGCSRNEAADQAIKVNVDARHI